MWRAWERSRRPASSSTSWALWRVKQVPLASEVPPPDAADRPRPGAKAVVERFFHGAVRAEFLWCCVDPSCRMLRRRPRCGRRHRREPSSGCGAPPPERPPETFHIGGRERHAIVVLPEEYRAEVPHALIFAFHGRTSPNAQARRYFGLEQAAERPAIYVYPAALTDRTGRFTWAEPGDPRRPCAISPCSITFSSR